MTSQSSFNLRRENLARLGDFPVSLRARYGTLRGAVRLLLSHADHMCGTLRRFSSVSWAEVERPVFVCRGNVCRSAYAERLIVEQGRQAASFGIHTWTGRPAYPAAVELAADRGIDLSAHRAISIEDFGFRRGDLLIAMEPRQARELAARAECNGYQITLLGLWGRPRRPHIHDPYNLDDAYLTTCFDVIESATANLASRLDRR